MKEPIDYRLLLIKYIHFIGENEGIDFIDSSRRPEAEVQFNDAEWEELERLSTTEPSETREPDPGQRYWGIWHEWTTSDGGECQSWFVDTTGRIYFYPSEAIARAAADYFHQNDPAFRYGGKFSAREFV